MMMMMFTMMMTMMSMFSAAAVKVEFIVPMVYVLLYGLDEFNVLFVDLKEWLNFMDTCRSYLSLSAFAAFVSVSFAHLEVVVSTN